MCLSAAALAALAVGGAAVGGKVLAPKIPDQSAALARADAEAAQGANRRTAARRKALASQSLITGGGEALSSGVLGGGRTILGG